MQPTDITLVAVGCIPPVEPNIALEEENIAVERMAPAALVDVASEDMVPLVVVSRQRNTSVICFFDEFDDWSRFVSFFAMVSGVTQF